MRRRRWWLLTAAALGVACARSVPARIPRRSPGKVAAVDFYGWPATSLNNGCLEVVFVPAIGRIMRLAFAGDGGISDPLWRHGQLGPALAPDENGWINYGGDKAWPAPQADWERIVGKGWPPPVTFDAMAYTTPTSDPGQFEMLSPLDSAYGMQVRRTARLEDDALLVDTAYKKVAGPPVRVAVWTITQLASPDRMFALLPERSAFTGGHRRVMPAPPKDLRVEGRLLSLARDTTEKTMIACDADALLWIGPGRDLLIEKIEARVEAAYLSRLEELGAPYVDGAHAQIYTSSDAAEPYVELELLGPLVDLAAGQRALMTIRYRLMRRQEADPLAEARRVFASALGTR